MPDGRGQMFRGWVKFQKENNLKPGDQCQFVPVIDKDNICEKIKVKVNRRGATTT